jgi:uncharacterized protein YabN with tetrapyrrole methylase and pyrophosphatase domain
MEQAAGQAGRNVGDLSLAEQEELWQRAKERESR